MLRTISILSLSCTFSWDFLDLLALIVHDRDVCCKAVAKMMQGKTPKEIQKLFKIESDSMPKQAVSPFINLS